MKRDKPGLRVGEQVLCSWAGSLDFEGRLFFFAEALWISQVCNTSVVVGLTTTEWIINTCFISGLPSQPEQAWPTLLQRAHLEAPGCRPRAPGQHAAGGHTAPVPWGSDRVPQRRVSFRTAGKGEVPGPPSGQGHGYPDWAFTRPSDGVEKGKVTRSCVWEVAHRLVSHTNQRCQQGTTNQTWRTKNSTSIHY